jgi:uncharacterized membrane-anchored protein
MARQEESIMIKYIVALMIAAQIAIPSAMIQRYESTIQNGSLYKFKVDPVDPADPFKGRYVRLNFDVSGWERKYQSDDQLAKKSNAYATLKLDSEGFVAIDRLYKSKPKDQEYLKVKVNYIWAKNKLNTPTTYTISLPFNRYYAQEDKAPEIERRVQRRNRNDEVTSSVDVRVLNGLGVIEQLYIDGKKVEEYFD